MREVSSERYKNFYSGNTSGIYQHRRRAVGLFCPTFYIRSPWNCVGGFPLAWRLSALLDRDEIKTREEVNYPFSASCFFSQGNQDQPVFPTGYIMEGRFLSRRLTLFRLQLLTTANVLCMFNDNSSA